MKAKFIFLLIFISSTYSHSQDSKCKYCKDVLAKDIIVNRTSYQDFFNIISNEEYLKDNQEVGFSSEHLAGGIAGVFGFTSSKEAATNSSNYEYSKRSVNQLKLVTLNTEFSSQVTNGLAYPNWMNCIDKCMVEDVSVLAQIIQNGDTIIVSCCYNGDDKKGATYQFDLVNCELLNEKDKSFKLKRGPAYKRNFLFRKTKLDEVSLIDVKDITKGHKNNVIKLESEGLPELKILRFNSLNSEHSTNVGEIQLFSFQLSKDYINSLQEDLILKVSLLGGAQVNNYLSSESPWNNNLRIKYGLRYELISDQYSKSSEKVLMCNVTNGVKGYNQFWTLSSPYYQTIVIPFTALREVLTNSTTNSVLINIEVDNYFGGVYDPDGKLIQTLEMKFNPGSFAVLTRRNY